MAEISFTERTVILRLVWFGAPQSGCGTNIRQLHRLPTLAEKSELFRSGGQNGEERSWSFHYEPETKLALGDFRTIVHCVSLPGSDASKIVHDKQLAGVDGIVFVADARAQRAAANVEAMLELELLLARQGLRLEALPLIFEVNQTDAASARPTSRVLEDLDPVGLPYLETMARQGTGLQEVLEAILSAVLLRLEARIVQKNPRLSLTALPLTEQEEALAQTLEHTAQLPPRPNPSLSSSLQPTTEITLRPPELRERTPVRHVRTDVANDRLRIEAIFRNPEGDLRKLAILVEPGAPPEPPPRTDAFPVKRQESTPHTPSLSLTRDRDLPPLAYGIIGVVGGLLCGILLHMLYTG